MQSLEDIRHGGSNKCVHLAEKGTPGDKGAENPRTERTARTEASGPEREWKSLEWKSLWQEMGYGVARWQPERSSRS